MIHGHTSLILKTKWGRVDRIESDNTFQDTVISRALRNLGECNASILNNSSFKAGDYWKETVGGILLFKDAVTTNTAYMSAGNAMTANGCEGIANAGNPPELGSWNSGESSASSAAIKLVYDWQTSQGNGQISSVCLTSKTGGLIGYGNASGEVYSSPFKLTRNLDLQTADSKTATDAADIIVGNFKYTFTEASGIVTVTKKKICITTGSVFDGQSTSKSFDLSVIGNPLSWNGNTCSVCASEGKIYVMPNIVQEVAPLGNIYMYEYNTADDTMVLKTITNSSSQTVRPRGSFSNTWCFGVSHGKLFVPDNVSDTNKTEIINISDSAFIEQIDAGHTTGGNRGFVGDLPNGLTIITDRNTNDSKYGAYIYDSTNGTAYPINCVRTSNDSAYQYTPWVYDSTTDTIGTNQSGVTAFNDPLYLATVNNLDNTVIKDATMTMKAIYTLEVV